MLKRLKRIIATGPLSSVQPSIRPSPGQDVPRPRGTESPSTGPRTDDRIDPVLVALGYHERTKHHYHQYARALGYLDWDTQPDPFRRFAGAPLLRLPLPKADDTPPFDQLYRPATIAPRPLSRDSLSKLLYYALALSAWKAAGGNTWALRVNPSSGNLHPTEGYLVAPAVDGLNEAAAVYHYAPKEHGLERRVELPPEVWTELTAGLPDGSFFVGLSSIHWREAWKYGERAYRYCQHDVGHALGALRYAAAALGWRLELLSSATDAQLGRLLGLDRSGDFPAGDEEQPDLLAVVFPVRARVEETVRGREGAGVQAGAGMRAGAGAREGARTQEATPARERERWADGRLEKIAASAWAGRANVLSQAHHAWEIVDVVAEACRRGHIAPVEAIERLEVGIEADIDPGPCREMSAGTIIRQRRSAVAMDGVTSIAGTAFYRMMDRLVPGLCAMPWDALPGPPRVHLGLFVHRVDGIPAGLYALVRDPARRDLLQGCMRPEFRWEHPPGCPPKLPLYLLLDAAVQRTATSVSCGQEIAGQSAFSLGMLAEFEPQIRATGAWLYRRLFWETGLIGQVLYLEAEAAGIRGTGIGCFFDDPVHEVFGLTDRTFQSLYHFTVGGPLEDTRLTTLPGYG